MNTFEEYLNKLQKNAGFKFKPIRWFASNLQKKFSDKIESYQQALEIARSWWNEKGVKALQAAKPPEIEVFSELRKDKDGSFYGNIYLVKDKADPINDEDKKILLDVMKKYGALRDMPFKEQKYSNGKIVYKSTFTFTRDKNQGIWINRFKHNIVDEIRRYSDKYSVSSRIPGWIYETDLQENNNMKTNTICEETKYTIDDVANALEGEDLKKAYGILFEMRYSEKDAEDLVNSYFYGDSWASADESKQALTEAYAKMPSGADLEPALSQEIDDPEKVKEILAAVDSLAKNQAARERLLEMFLDEDHTGFVRGFGKLFEVPYDDEDQIMYRWLELVEGDPRAALMYQFENVGIEIFDDVLQVAGGVKEAKENYPTNNELKRFLSYVKNSAKEAGISIASIPKVNSKIHGIDIKINVGDEDSQVIIDWDENLRAYLQEFEGIDDEWQFDFSIDDGTNLYDDAEENVGLSISEWYDEPKMDISIKFYRNKSGYDESKEVIKEEGEESSLPAVPESPDQLVAKVVEIRGKIDSVAKSVANIQAYCANHTDQREINDLTVDLNSGVQDAIEALDDIITAAGDQKKEDKKAAADAIDQIA